MATLVGAGATEALATDGIGTVLASFSRACYVSLPSGLLALVAPGVPPGPLHVVLDAPPPMPPTGATVLCSSGRLLVDGREIRVPAGSMWMGSMPSPAALRRASGAVVEEAARAAAASLLAPKVRPHVRSRLERGDLVGAAGVLVGRGPGLTPAGDDVLAGLLFVSRLLGGPEAEGRLEYIAHGARTTLISRAFLVWAARGQAIAPVHDLLDAAVAGHRGLARRAAEALERVGESSGADFALGLRWGIETLGSWPGRVS